MKDQVVERVLLGKEVFKLRVARAACLVQKADVSACTEVAKHPFLVAATNGNRQHLWIVFPGQQLGVQITHHAQRKCIDGFGAV